MRDDFGFELATESIPLPSQGKVYPTGSPLHACETVDIRSMTAREEDILTSKALIKKGTVITELIKSCLINKSIDVDSMLAGDRNSVMISLRITGYGQKYDADIVCAACNNKVTVSFDLAALGIKRLNIEPIKEGENLFAFDLPVTKQKVKFKFMTGADEADLLQEAERRRKIVGMGSSDSLVTGRLQRCVVQVGEITDKGKISSFVRAMPAGDSRALRKYMDENEPGIDMNASCECPQCAEQQEVTMPLGVSFFWPDA